MSSSKDVAASARTLRLRPALAMVAPFVMIALWHYVRYVTLLQPGQEHAAIRAKTRHAEVFRRHMADRMAKLSEAMTTSSAVSMATSAASAASAAAASASQGVQKAATVAAAATPATVRRHFAGGLSSEDAMKKVLAQASLQADDAEGLGEVTTPGRQQQPPA